MDFFDQITDFSFKSDVKGGDLFYRWGVFGKGYVLPDESKKQRIRRFLKLYYKISLPSILFVGLLLGWIVSFALLPILIFWYFLATACLLRGLPIADVRLSIRDSYEDAAQVYDITLLWAALICCILFVLAGIAILLFHKDKWLGLASIVCFGGAGCVVWYMIKVKRN